MQRVRNVLGWIVTVVAGAAFVGVLTAVLVGGEILEARLPATDPDEWWMGLLLVVVLFGGIAAFWLYALFSRKGREARRQLRAERAARRRKLENFEL